MTLAYLTASPIYLQSHTGFAVYCMKVHILYVVVANKVVSKVKLVMEPAVKRRAQAPFNVCSLTKALAETKNTALKHALYVVCLAVQKEK